LVKRAFGLRGIIIQNPIHRKGPNSKPVQIYRALAHGLTPKPTSESPAGFKPREFPDRVPIKANRGIWAPEFNPLGRIFSPKRLNMRNSFEREFFYPKISFEAKN